MTPASGLRVAVVGAGPAGLFVADALVRSGSPPVQVDVLDRLPTPFGLLRYGVAPDHLKIKSLARTMQRTLDDERVRFFGNVAVGADVTVEELRTRYHAVVYAFGAATDRRLDIPGEGLPGSASATDFVGWYSGHPDVPADRFELDGVSSAVVVGMGNVAVDVARVLCTDAAALGHTDVPEPVLRRLGASSVTDVHVLGRRGPLHARFTTKELRELGDLDGVAVVVDPAQLELDDQEQADLRDRPALARTVDVLRSWTTRSAAGAPRRLHLHFWSRPVAVLGADRVEAVRVEPTRLDGSGRCVASGEASDLRAQLLLRSVGYRGAAVPGVPLDQATGTVPHQAGRVCRDGAVSSGEYVTGWIGRGPVGVLGTNRADAEGVVEQLLADADGLLARALPALDPAALLGRAGTPPVTAAGWASIDAAEVALGASQGRPRSKLASWGDLLTAAAAGGPVVGGDP